MRAIDIFCGAGGLSEGATQAGVEVLVAANHWPLAVESHQRNHPRTKHICQDVALLDARDLPRFDLLLAAPACQGHSDAKGEEKPHHDAQRMTAWSVIDIAEVTEPRALIVENVLKMRKWKLYPLWLEALKRLGYLVRENIVCPSEHGVPQERPRLIVTALRGKMPPPILPLGLPAPFFRSVIDWTLPMGPIKTRQRSPATLARVARARETFGDAFVMPYYSKGSGLTGRSLDRPLGTVTTRDRWAIVVGDRMRMVQVPEYKAVVGFRPDYELFGTRAEQIHQLGNATSPVVGRAAVLSLQEAA